MKIFILGANGFIGSHLSQAIIAHQDWHVSAMDIQKNNLIELLDHPRFEFKLGDITQEQEWIARMIKACDVVIPLAAIATPASYIKNPLRVFELDFEANLAIIRTCVQFSKRLIFPSTSEVYGMCQDSEFDEEKSVFVTGPIAKERWIYATAKQLLDRMIYAYGRTQQLSFTLFRPFNWYGPRLDQIANKNPGGSRVITQFMGNILRNEDICLVDGGWQKRCFTFIEDGIEALLKIIENKNGCASQAIFNIGNPDANISIRDLAELLLMLIKKYPQYRESLTTKLKEVTAQEYYGEGYQDVNVRVPSISRAKDHLGWVPKISLATGIQKTLDFYFQSND